MKNKNIKQTIIFLLLAFVGWALCGAIMMFGMQVTSLQATLIIHAIGAPIIFGVIAFIYYGRFSHAPPLKTALLFVGIVILMDFFVVASLIEKSYAMFANPLGTWIPFVLIFTSVYLVGVYRLRGKTKQVAA